jgi:hypothetical protein
MYISHTYDFFTFYLKLEAIMFVKRKLGYVATGNQNASLMRTFFEVFASRRRVDITVHNIAVILLVYNKVGSSLVVIDKPLDANSRFLSCFHRQEMENYHPRCLMI